MTLLRLSCTSQGQVPGCEGVTFGRTAPGRGHSWSQGMWTWEQTVQSGCFKMHCFAFFCDYCHQPGMFMPKMCVGNITPKALSTGTADVLLWCMSSHQRTVSQHACVSSSNHRTSTVTTIEGGWLAMLWFQNLILYTYVCEARYCHFRLDDDCIGLSNWLSAFPHWKGE